MYICIYSILLAITPHVFTCTNEGVVCPDMKDCKYDNTEYFGYANYTMQLELSKILSKKAATQEFSLYLQLPCQPLPPPQHSFLIFLFIHWYAAA